MSSGFSAISFNGPVTFNCNLVLGETVGNFVDAEDPVSATAAADFQETTLSLLNEILERQEDPDCEQESDGGYDTQEETDDSDSDESLMEEGRANETANQNEGNKTDVSHWSEGLFPHYPVALKAAFPEQASVIPTPTGFVIHFPIQ